MKTSIKTIALLLLLIVTVSSCSSSDPVSPVTPTSGFVCIESSNANTPAGDCNNWNLVYESPGFSTPNILRNDSFAPALMTTNVVSNQCSAYNKTTKIFLVGIGDRIIKYVYGPTMATSVESALPPITYMGGNVQAMEYIGNRLFIIKNNVLEEYNPNTLLALTSFTPITVPSVGHISNMSSFLNKLYFIDGDTLYSVDTTFSTSALIVAAMSLPPTASGVPNYDGLEVKDASTFYAVSNDTSAIANNKFVKITSSGATTEISGLPLTTTYNRLSSAYDYDTEYYYGVSYNLATNTSTVFAIDLTPLSGPLTAAPILVGNYVFGLQLKD